MHTTWTDDASDPILTLWCDRCDQPFQTNTITTLCRPCQQAADTCRITTRTELRFAHAHARNNP
jgi:hypothetical protein